MRFRPQIIVTSLMLSTISILPLAGCGSDNRLPTATVKGKVTYNGEPLQIGSLLFVPVGGGPSAEANIDRNGNYAVGTYETTDGAVLGKHQVLITAFTSPGGSGLPEDAVKGDAAPVSVIPEKFGDLAKSGLEVEVKSGKNDVDFVLTAKSGEVKLNN
jgi:hypothetical protein